MAEKDNEIIQAPSFNFTRAGASVAAVIGILTPAIVTLVDKLAPGKVPLPVTLAAFAAVLVGLLVVAFLAAVDVLARAYVTGVKMRSGIGLAATYQQNPVIIGAVAMTGTPLELQVRGRGQRLFKVLAVRWDPSAGASQYLVGRRDEKPVWIKDEEVDCLYLTNEELINRPNGTQTRMGARLADSATS